MDLFVQLEGIQLVGVVPLEANPHPLEKLDELRLVIADDKCHVGLALRLGGLCGIGAHADSTVSQAPGSIYLFSMTWLPCTTISDPGGRLAMKMTRFEPPLSRTEGMSSPSWPSHAMAPPTR
jgi:hypothetical protein